MVSFSFDLALRYAGEYAQVEELIVEARARGCREIGLYASEETPRAFYEKLGFRYAGPEVRLPLV